MREAPAKAQTVRQRHIALPLEECGLQARQISLKEGHLDPRMLAFECLQDGWKPERREGANSPTLSSPTRLVASPRADSYRESACSSST